MTNIIGLKTKVAVLGCDTCEGIHFCLADKGELICSESECFMESLRWITVANEELSDE
jgi:hypothetical protein